MRKRWITLAVIAAVTVLVASLAAAVRGSSASAAPKALSACLVTDIGGLNDKSFNHLAYVGLQLAEKRGIKGRVIQSKSAADYIPNLQECEVGRRDHDRRRLHDDRRDGRCRFIVQEQQVRDRGRRREGHEALYRS